MHQVSNPHVILKSNNSYGLSKKLTPHNSLTAHLNEMNSGREFKEMTAKKYCKYYEYKRVVESYIGKNGKPTEYTRTARVDFCEPVCMLVEKLHGLGDKYLKHRTYVDNVSSIFPISRVF